MLDGEGIARKHLRWHVVRNRHPGAPISFDRELEESKFFSQMPWLEIPKEQRGSLALKNYVGKLLCNRIRTGFPELQRTVKDKLQEEEARLVRLGKPRGNIYLKSNYLRDIVKTYEDLARKALTSPAELPSDELKLRGVTRTMEADFAIMMEREGHHYKFLEIGQEVEADWSTEESDSDSNSDSRTITVVSDHQNDDTANSTVLTFAAFTQK